MFCLKNKEQLFAENNGLTQPSALHQTPPLPAPGQKHVLFLLRRQSTCLWVLFFLPVPFHFEYLFHYFLYTKEVYLTIKKPLAIFLLDL